MDIFQQLGSRKQNIFVSFTSQIRTTLLHFAWISRYYLLAYLGGLATNKAKRWFNLDKPYHTLRRKLQQWSFWRHHTTRWELLWILLTKLTSTQREILDLKFPILFRKHIVYVYIVLIMQVLLCCTMQKIDRFWNKESNLDTCVNNNSFLKFLRMRLFQVIFDLCSGDNPIDDISCRKYHMFWISRDSSLVYNAINQAISTNKRCGRRWDGWWHFPMLSSEALVAGKSWVLRWMRD